MHLGIKTHTNLFLHIIWYFQSIHDHLEAVSVSTYKIAAECVVAKIAALTQDLRVIGCVTSAPVHADRFYPQNLLGQRTAIDLVFSTITWYK